MSEESQLRVDPLVIHRKSFVVVTGMTGGGKTSFLMSLAGRLHVLSGHIAIRGSLAFVALTSGLWKSKATIRSYICGSSFNAIRYAEILRACNIDFSHLQDGDATPMSSDSISIGERCLFGLARAVYKDVDILVIDDIFQRMSINLVTWIYARVIQEAVRRNKTVILVTERKVAVSQADIVLDVIKGRVSVRGMNRQSGSKKMDMDGLFSDDDGGMSVEKEENAVSGRIAALKVSRYEPLREKRDLPPLDLSKTTFDPNIESPTLPSDAFALDPVTDINVIADEIDDEPIASTDRSRSSDSHANNEEICDAVGITFMEAGLFYLSGGGILLVILVLTMILSLTVVHFVDIWYTIWVTQQTSAPPFFFVNGLVILTVISLLLLIARSMLFSAVATSASRALFSSLGNVLLATPAFAFDYIETISRYTTDLSLVIDTLPTTLQAIAVSSVSLLLSLVILTFLSPIILAVLPFLLGLISLTYKFFSRGQYQIMNLRHEHDENLVDAFSRVVYFSRDFISLGSQRRVFKDILLSLHMRRRTHVAAELASQWLTVRLQLLTCGLIFIVTLTSILSHMKLIPESKSEFDAESAVMGLSFVIVLGVAQLLNTLLTSFEHLAKTFDAIQRIMMYIRSAATSSEEDPAYIIDEIHIQGRYRPLGSVFAVLDTHLTVSSILWSALRGLRRVCIWPIYNLVGRVPHKLAVLASKKISEMFVEYTPVPVDHGDGDGPILTTAQMSPATRFRNRDECLRLSNISFRYAPNKPWSLRNITISFSSREKVAVIGLTGSGKSSLAQICMRMLRPQEGTVHLFGRDMSAVSVRHIQPLIGVVPQSPFLLYASVRENVDPEGRHSDEDIIEVLKALRLWDMVCELAQSAEEPVAPAHLRPVPIANTPMMRRQDLRRQRLLPQHTRTRSSMQDLSLNPVFSVNPTDVIRHTRVLGHVIHAGSLSEGEKQRVGLARVFLRKPPLVIMDECTNSLDELSAAMAQVMIHRHLFHSCVVQCTQDLGVVLENETLLLLEHGSISEMGRPARLARDPTSRLSRLISMARATNTPSTNT
jgi:ABC-type multidrug transport system fused ATPase/permease subunit